MSGQTESTPLIGDDVKSFVSNIFSPENVDSAKAQAKTKMQELRRSASEGDFSIRLLALVGGVVLVISSAVGFVGLLFSFQLSRAVLEIYTLCLGMIMLLLESQGHIQKQQENLTAEQRATLETQMTFLQTAFRSIFKYAMFLKFVWGRGGLYFVAGSLQFAQGGWIDYLIGGFVMLVGVLYILVGRRTAGKLTQLRQALAEHTLRAKFSEADTEGDGKLSLDDFSVLTESLGMTLTRREREVAFLCMDQRDSGSISFADFKAWWSDWEDGTVM